MRNRTKRFVSLLTALLLILGILAGCSNPDASSNAGGGQPAPAGSTAATSDGGTAAARDDLIIAASSEPATLHPIDQTYMMTAVMCFHMCNQLVKLDDDLNTVPDLAESIDQPSDTEYIFNLRQGVKFHNGEEMKAEDVKASLEYTGSFPRSSQFVATIADIEVVDDYTVKVTTNGPTSRLLLDLTNPQASILPKSLIDSGHDFAAQPIATGPMKFVSYTAGDKLVFEAFDDYFDKDNPPRMKTITWRFIPEGSARTIALEAGEVDFLYDVEAIDIPSLQANDAIEVHLTDSVAQHRLDLNLLEKPFDNADFRKALGYAIDRDAIVAVSVQGLGVPSLSAGPMGMFGSKDDGCISYDPEKAAEYFEKSGVDPATVTLPILASNEMRKRQAEVIQANLSEFGITVEIETVDFATNMSLLDAKDFVGSLGSYAQRSLPLYLTFIYESVGSFAANRSYANPEADRLLTEINSTQDDAKREALTHECLDVLNEDYSSIPLIQDKYVKAYNQNLGGINVNPLGSTYYHMLYWK